MAFQALLWLLLLLQHASACEDLTCFADYDQTLTCLQGNNFHTSSRRAPYNLVAKWDCGDGGSCSFRPTSRSVTHMEYSCFAEQTMCASINSFTVEVKPLGDEQLNSSVRGCQKWFGFSANFKPHPPFNLTIDASHDGYNISWKTKYQHRLSHLDGELQYELRYRQKGHPWQEQDQKKHLLQDTRTLRLLPHELEGSSEYEVQVRAGPGEQGQAYLYQGTWSEWSSLAQLRTLPKAVEGREEAQWLVPLFLLLSPLAVVMVFRGCHQRLWKKLDILIPSPAPFFQPLYWAHNGDFKKWVGTSCSQATLDVFEWGTVLPEVFRIGPGHHPLSLAKGCQALPLEPATSHLAGHQQASLDSHSLTQEQSYGHLSIDTVTVAGGPAGCCPHSSCASICCALEQWEEEAAERDAYRGMDLDGGSSDKCQIPRGLLLQNVLLQSHSFPSGSECLGKDSLPALLQVGHSLGRKAEEGVDFFGWPLKPWDMAPPLCFSSPDEERLFYSDLLSPDVEADGDTGNGLDLDTIDSGFADSDCISPMDCEFERRHSGCGAELSAGEGEEVQEAFLPSYVKQWVSCHNRTPPS